MALRPPPTNVIESPSMGGQPPVRNQMGGSGGNSLASPGDLRQSNGGDNNNRSLWARLWPAAARGDSLAGFLLGLLLVLLLVLSCFCCCYCGFLLWQRHFRRWWHQLLATSDDDQEDGDEISRAKQVAARAVGDGSGGSLTSSQQSSFTSSSAQRNSRRRQQLMRAEQLADELERDALNSASQQNIDNAQRQAAVSLAFSRQQVAGQPLSTASGSGVTGQQQRTYNQTSTPPQPPARLHSILKKGGSGSQSTQPQQPLTTLIPPTSGAPLAAFTPVESPQRRHLISPGFQVATSQRVGGASSPRGDFRPTPARRHARPVPPPPPPPSAEQQQPQSRQQQQQHQRPPPEHRHQFRTSPLRAPPTPPPELPPSDAGHPLGQPQVAAPTIMSHQQRVTYYHYSSSKTTHMSQSYLEQMAASEQAETQGSPLSRGVDKPERQTKPDSGDSGGQEQAEAKSTSATRSYLI